MWKNLRSVEETMFLGGGDLNGCFSFFHALEVCNSYFCEHSTNKGDPLQLSRFPTVSDAIPR